MVAVAQEITGAAEFWNDRYTGAGVDVALVDSGVIERAVMVRATMSPQPQPPRRRAT